MQPIQEQITTTDDLKAINQIAYAALTADDVFTFKLRIIDNEPTANGRLYTKEWREANAAKFVGAPIIYRHDITGSAEAVGYVFKTALEQDALYGWAYIPTNTASGQDAVQKVYNGQLRSMSLHAISPNVTEHGEVTHVLPSKDDRILEVSFVAVGGCATCGVVKDECEDTAESAEDAFDKALRDFGREQWAEIQDEYIRLAAFAFGTGIDKRAYKSVAENVHPRTLKAMIADLKKTIADKKRDGESEEMHADDATVHKLKDTVRNIRKAKGV